ncbi:type II toxin-antitoxin system VapC family toxin [Candidatus Poribacteria bacterium]|nr:type II toxin-antitoxin system VapC family toxin [Candidatus Poribacteria bacterium]
MNLFFDTSALVKFFHEEIGTELVTQLINNPQNEVWISELTIVEFLSVMYRLYREEEIVDDELEEAINGFEEECHRFIVVPLNIVIIEEARDLLNTYGKYFSLRTLDALQLASCNFVYEDDENWTIVSSDHRLIRVIQNAGMNVINPEEQE